MVSRLTVALLACLVLVVPATASAALDVSHDRVDVTEVSGVLDGVAAPGDRLNLRERFRSATQITGVTGHLLSTTPGVTVEDSTAPFPDIPAGGLGENNDPFDVILPATGLDCGTRLVFAMSVVANEDSGAFAFTIPTGAPGPVKVYGDDPARAIDDATVNLEGAVVPGVTEVLIDVPETESGLIKSLNLRLPQIDHPRMGDLKLELIAPDATKIVLADRRGGTGANMVNTVFSDSGSPIGGASAPFTGTYAPEEPLRILEGRRLAGPWTLRITDSAIGETGTLQSWRIDARRAFCAGIPIARMVMSHAGAPVTQVQPGQQVDFDASTSSDQNGAIVSYDFDLDGQPGYEIEGTTDTTHSFTYPTRGTYPVSVRVTDDAGLTDTETIDLPVTDAPVAALTASALTPLSHTAVTFSATGSVDPDGSVNRYEWDLDGNGSFETDTQGAATASMTYETPGARTVRVRVTDNLGARDTEQVVVTVQNRPPVAAATHPALILAGQETTIDATASSDPDGTVRRYQWDLDGNGTFEHDMADEPILTHTFTAGGPLAVSLRVTDNSGAGDTEVFPIVVRHAPDVRLSATPNPASPRRPVTVTAAATDADSAAGTLTYAWDLDGNGTYEVAPGTQSTRTMQWPVGGTRTVGVRVVDPEGASDAATVQVVVRNLLPTANLVAAGSVLVGTSLALDARGSTDPDGDVMTYRWDLDGNGSFEHDTGTTGTAAVTYSVPGTARPAVRVTDDDAATSTKAIDVAVTSPAPPPDTGDTGGTPPAGDSGASAAPSSPVALAPPPPVPRLGGTRAIAPAPRPPAFTAALAGASAQKLKTVLRKGVSLTCTASSAGRCLLEARLSGRDAKKLGLTRSSKKPFTVGRATATLVAGKPARIALRLSAKARRKLARKPRVRLLLSGFARDWGGRQASVSRVVLLRR